MAEKHEDLECWQLADRLRTEVVAICEQPAVARHYKFCEGFCEAAGSVCRNIAEGFGRFGSRYIVQFFGYSLGSLNEVQDYLKECRTRKFIDAARYADAIELLEHTRATTLNFRRHHKRKP